jgi:hypothetical protein
MSTRSIASDLKSWFKRRVGLPSKTVNVAWGAKQLLLDVATDTCDVTYLCLLSLSFEFSRFGKSVSVAMYVLALLLHVPGIRVCIFSTGKRASGKLVGEIMERIKNIPGATKRVIKQNQEQVSFTNTSSRRPLMGDKRTTTDSCYALFVLSCLSC